MTKIALYADVHAPYQDNKSIELACKLIQLFNPDRVYDLGDGNDFYQFSKFSQDPRRRLRFQDDLDAGFAVRKQLRSAAPDADSFYIPGNHDERWPKYLAMNQELSELRSLSLSSILKLDELNIELCDQQVVENEDRVG